MIKRTVQEALRKRLFKGKAILLFGPRQVGKSTLIEILLEEEGQEYRYLNDDDADVREILTNTTATKLKAIVATGKWYL